MGKGKRLKEQRKMQREEAKEVCFDSSLYWHNNQLATEEGEHPSKAIIFDAEGNEHEIDFLGGAFVYVGVDEKVHVLDNIGDWGDIECELGIDYVVELAKSRNDDDREYEVTKRNLM